MKIKPTCSRVSVILVHHANEIQRIFSFMSYTLHAIKNKKFRVIKTTDWYVFLSTCHVKYKYKCLSVTNMLLKVNTSTDWMKDFHLKVLMRKTSILRDHHITSTARTVIIFFILNDSFYFGSPTFGRLMQRDLKAMKLSSTNHRHELQTSMIIHNWR